jgi:hypothetical protein
MLRLLASTLVLALGMFPVMALAGPAPLDITDFTPRFVNIGIDATDLITPLVPPGPACLADPIRIDLAPACRDEHITMNPSALRAGMPLTGAHPAPEAAIGNGTGTESFFIASGGAVTGSTQNILTGFYNPTPGAIVLPDTGAPGIGNDPFNPFDGETAPAESVFVPEVILRAFIDAGGTFITLDPNLVAGDLPWSDLVYNFDAAAAFTPTGEVSYTITGTVLSTIGKLPFAQIANSTPGIGDHFLATILGDAWDFSTIFGFPALDPNGLIPGTHAGVAYFDVFGTAIDGFCSVDGAGGAEVVNVTTAAVFFPCIPTPGVTFDPVTGLVLMTGPTRAGSLLTMTNTLGDVLFTEVPEPGTLLLLGAGLASLAALRIRRKA